MNTSPPPPKRGGETERDKKFGKSLASRGVREDAVTPTARRALLLIFFWIDDDGKAQLQEAALPWKSSLAHPPDPVLNDYNCGSCCKID